MLIRKSLRRSKIKILAANKVNFIQYSLTSCEAFDAELVSFDALKWQICIILRFSPSLSYARSYKIVIWFIWKISPYLHAVDADHITRGENDCYMYRCVAKNGSLMFLSPWGKFFISLRSPFSARFYLFSVRHFCRLRLETNSTKTLFPCFDIAHCFLLQKIMK